VKGKSQAVKVFEIYDADSQLLITLKRQTRPEFEQAVTLYIEGNFAQAQQVFQQVLQKNAQDWVAKLYVERCQKSRRFGLSELNIVIN
jgi:two-component system sensor histidine kinase ChiS